MARSRKQRKGRGGLSARGLLVVILALCLVGALGYVWYNAQSQSERVRIARGFAASIESMRESEKLPISTLLWLDGMMEKLPGVMPEPVSVQNFDVVNNLAYAGFPDLATKDKATRRITILQNSAYAVGYDEDLRAPLWSAFRLFKVPTTQAPPRPDGFITDKRSKARVTTDDYRGSGFDRGHLAPSYGIGLCYGAEAQKETFLLTNIIAQDPTLNRGVWAALERRKATRIAYRLGEVWVIMGPIFTSNPPRRLDSGIAIPDKMFCVLLDARLDGSVRTLALVMPNDGRVSPPLSRYIVTVDEVEALTGLDFFAALPDTEEAAIEAMKSAVMW